MHTAQELLRRFHNEKTLPHVAIRLTKLISNEKSSFQEFEQLIRMDPTLILRILRMANSAYYGLKQKVENISRVLVFIGMKNLRNMIVTEALKGIFKGQGEDDLFSRSKLWLHCAAVGVCSQMISERIFGQNGEDSFLCGILHDIGMIVEEQVSQDLFMQTCKAYEPDSRSITAYEQEIIGTDHCEVGKVLAYEWKLPDEVQTGIQRHHKILKDIPPSSISGIIQTSEYLVSKMNYVALPGMVATLSPPLVAHIKENLGEYKLLIKDLPEELAKAKEIYQSEEAA